MDFEILDCNTIFGPWPLMRADMSAQRLITAMKNHNVSKALTISTLGALHNAGDGNAETLRVCAENDMLMPVATIDPRGYFGQPAAITNLPQQGFKMIRFFPLLQEWPMNHSAFCDALDAANETGLPIMIQARETGCPSSLAGVLNGRSNIFILEGVKFENMAETISVMRKHENVMIETRELRVPGTLRFIVDQVGADRILFGSGCLRSSLASALNYVMDSEVDDEAKAKILGANLKRILGG